MKVEAAGIGALDEQVLVFAPSGHDGSTVVAILDRAGISAVASDSASGLCQRAARGVAAVVLSQEALDATLTLEFGALLRQQPAWSDLPVIVFMSAGAGQAQVEERLRAALGNVTVVQRPASPINLVTAVHSALRARQRQYQIRDLLQRRDDEIRQRDQFLAMLGHELRNPLGAITNAAELISRMVGGDSIVRKPVDIVKRQAAHLARLVNDLLDVARVTSGKLELALERLDLRVVLTRTVEALADRARAGGLTLVDASGSEPLWVNGDPIRLEQVFTNLVVNAIKYTPAGGRIEITAGRLGGVISVDVTDSGVGIESDMLEQVFELFAQAEPALDRAQGGMGVGLTIVRSLVRRHNGEVRAHSAGKNQGSRFTIILPTATPATATVGPDAPLAGQAGQGRTVMIIEDNADNRETMRELLEDAGYRVEEAGDGQRGLERILELNPSAALIDVGLPGLDGYHVARGVRAALGPSPLLIAITGYGQVDDERRSQQAGFDAHLTKPVNMATLLRLLDRAAPVVDGASTARPSHP
jgi:signal transduction histidine kinase/ActR/RegA family two-component response regulator